MKRGEVIAWSAAGAAIVVGIGVAVGVSMMPSVTEADAEQLVAVCKEVETVEAERSDNPGFAITLAEATCERWSNSELLQRYGDRLD